jgi:cation:H+ antiporter
MFVFILFFAAAIGILYFGANTLVKGSSALALKLGMSALVVGLTVVAFCTSAPELVVSLNATWSGQGNIAIGNVIGSNIINICLILGLAAVVRPLITKLQLLQFDIPWMIAMMLLFLLFFTDKTIGRMEGIVLFLLLIGYIAFQIIYSRKITNNQIIKEYREHIKQPKSRLFIDILFIIIGLGLLIGGSELMVYSAIKIAKNFGMSDALIGLTIIAAGTSMPELATSVVASYKKKPDIAVGNIIGSSIFNILAILGLSGTLKPLYAPEIGYRDSLVMVGISFVLIFFLKTGFKLSRWEGAILMVIYFIYLFLLIP